MVPPSTTSLPQAQLRLEWIHGYRGHRCHNNVYLTGDQRSVVYFVAGVAIVYDTEKQEQHYYMEHDDDLTSLAVHPDHSKRLAASGQLGKHPKICVWNTKTLETVSIMENAHHVGVACLDFGGPRNKYLASAGLDDEHTVCIWEWKKGQLVASAAGHPSRIYSFMFNPFVPSMLVSCGAKHVRFWTLRGSALTGKPGMIAPSVPADDAADADVPGIETQLCAMFTNANTCITGSSSGALYFWYDGLVSDKRQEHEGAVFSMYSEKGGLVTAGKDGRIIFWDSKFNKDAVLNVGTGANGQVPCLRAVHWVGDSVAVGTLDSRILLYRTSDQDHPLVVTEGHSQGDLWGLAEHPTDPRLFATASEDGSIRLWDAAARRCVSVFSHESPARCLCFVQDGRVLVVGLQTGGVAAFSVAERRMLWHVENRQEAMQALAVTSTSRSSYVLATGNNDGFVDLYKVDGDGPTRSHSFQASKDYVAQLDFSHDGKYLQVDCGNGQHVVYDVAAKASVASKDVPDITWGRVTTPLTPSVAGIWGHHKNPSEINACHAKNSFVVSGDDYGRVNLHNFPTTAPKAPHRSYRGHSDQVTNVRFSCDASRVYSTGGLDFSVFQWSFTLGTSQPSMSYDSFDEDSDLELGEDMDYEDVDSDVEREAAETYSDRTFKEEIQEKKQQTRDKLHHAVRASAPADGLSIHAVHGYRGYDCRANLFFTTENRLLYHVAAVGIVCDPESGSQLHYRMHDDDILSMSYNAERGVAATGQIGRDPPIHIWRPSDLKTMSILKGHHSRGVSALDFDSSGKRLVSAGLDDEHTICVWDWAKGTCLASTRGSKEKIFMVRFNPYADNELVSVGVKHIKFWQQAGGGLTGKRGVFGRNGPMDTMLSVTFAEDGSAVTGSAKGKVYRWKGSQLAKTMDAHRGPLFVLEATTRGFISAGKDGTIALWSKDMARQIKTYPISTDALSPDTAPLTKPSPAIRAVTIGHVGSDSVIFCGTINGEVLSVSVEGTVAVVAQGHGQGEVWGLATHPFEPIFATASDDSTVREWDIPRRQLLRILQLDQPCRAVAYSKDEHTLKLAVGMKGGHVVVYQHADGRRVTTLKHRKQEISDIKFSPNDKLMAVGSHENFVDIYDTRTFHRVGICKGASSYITHVDWDVTSQLLMVNTGAKEELFFEAPKGKRVPLSHHVRENLQWATWTSVLASDVQGIWPHHSDVTDVNSCCRAEGLKVLATADDFGLVKLFDFPCPTKYAKFKKYQAHSAHVTNVRFTHDNRYLISTGGNDTSVIVWDFSGADRGSRASRRATLTPLLASEAGMAGDSDDSDTDEDEDGYDSDVTREKNIDYSSKIYRTTLRHKHDPHVQASTSHHSASFSGTHVSRKKCQRGKRNAMTKKGSAKLAGLELHRVIGYRGFDSRNNLRYLGKQGKHIVFPAAGTGVVQNIETGEQMFYLDHTDDIMCLAVNPKNPELVATGQLGTDAAIHVWDSTSLETYSVMMGVHERGVCSLSFSANGKLLASVALDDNASLAVHKWQTGACVAKASASHNRIFVLEFRPDSNTEFVTAGIKHLKFWTLAGSTLIPKRAIVGRDRKMTTLLSVAFGDDNITYGGAMSGDIWVFQGNQLAKVIECKNRPYFTLSTYDGQRGRHVIAGNKDGFVRVFEPSSDGLAQRWETRLEGEELRSVVRTNGGRMLVGTEASKIFELRRHDAIPLMRGHAEGEVWGLGSHPFCAAFATVGDDGYLNVWEPANGSLIDSFKLGAPARSVSFSPDGGRIAVGFDNGAIKILAVSQAARRYVKEHNQTKSTRSRGDADNASHKDWAVLFDKRDRSTSIQDLKFSPSGERLAVASDDKTIDFYSVASEPIKRDGYCKGIGSEVTHIDWSDCGRYLKINTAQLELLYCDTKTGAQLPPQKLEGPPNWSTWTSVLGPDVVGVWQKAAGPDPAPHVYCAAVSHNGQAVVTGDDSGFVRAFPFPAAAGVHHTKHVGHSANVTNVSFTADDNFVVTTGGDDCCVFVWKALWQ